MSTVEHKSQDRSAELLEQVQQALATKTPLRLQGGNTKSFLGKAVQGQELSLAGHEGVVDYDPAELVVTVRAGTPLAEVEAALRRTIADAAASFRPPRGGHDIRVDVKRILLARALQPLPGNQPLVEAIQKHGQAVFGESIAAVGTPLYTDVRLYAEHGIPGVIYGAGPRTVRESNAKRADEHLVLEDLRRATKVIARTLLDLLQPT